MKTPILMLTVLAAAGLFLTGCGNSNSSKSSSSTANTTTNTKSIYDSGNPITVVPDYVGAVMQAKKYSEKQIDLAYLHEDIQEFNAAEGRYPTNLQEMIPNYLGKMPKAPYGYKIVYNPQDGTVKVVKEQ
jgi:ABC-type glycerol-3-phosphate transport system substrate-binding protein